MEFKQGVETAEEDRMKPIRDKDFKEKQKSKLRKEHETKIHELQGMQVEDNQDAATCAKKSKARSKAKSTAAMWESLQDLSDGGSSDNAGSSDSFTSMVDQDDSDYDLKEDQRLTGAKRKTAVRQKRSGGSKKKKTRGTPSSTKSPYDNDFLGDLGSSGGGGGGANEDIIRHLKQTARSNDAQAEYYRMLMEQDKKAKKVAKSSVVKANISGMANKDLVEWVKGNALGAIPGLIPALVELDAEGSDFAHIKEADLTSAKMKGFHARKAMIRVKELCFE
jgi:hypothetical protein